MLRCATCGSSSAHSTTPAPQRRIIPQLHEPLISRIELRDGFHVHFIIHHRHAFLPHGKQHRFFERNLFVSEKFCSQERLAWFLVCPWIKVDHLDRISVVRWSPNRTLGSHFEIVSEGRCARVENGLWLVHAHPCSTPTATSRSSGGCGVPSSAAAYLSRLAPSGVESLRYG